MFSSPVRKEMDSENENRFSFLKNTAAGSFFRVFSSFFEKKNTFRFPIPAFRLSANDFYVGRYVY